MKQKTLTYLKRSEPYIEIAVSAALFLGILFAGHYLYTGKAWLLFTGRETLADFYFNRGSYYFNGGAYDLNIAKTNFQKALAHADGYYPVAHYQLGRIEFVQGNFTAALIHMDNEPTGSSIQWRIHYMKGLMYGFRKQYVRAEEEFNASIAKEPYPTWAGRNDLAWIYFAQGKYQDAADIAWDGLKRGTVSEPFVGWLQNSYAVAQMNLGNYQIAQQYFLLAQKNFEIMTPEQWGISYTGNDPQHYEDGLAQIQIAIEKNLELVHSKLQSQ